MQLEMPCSLCMFQQAFCPSGEAPRASPSYYRDYCSNILSSLNFACTLDSMRPLCYGMRSHPCLSSLCLSSMPQLNSLLTSLPRTSCCPSHTQTSTLASRAGFGFGCPVPALCTNVHPARRVARRPPICTLFREKRFTPAAPSDPVTPSLRICVRRIQASTPRTPSERPGPYRPCCDSPSLSPGRVASRTDYPLCQPPGDGSGGYCSGHLARRQRQFP